ncbi:pyruvate, phosphate dikinase [Patulibacter sp. NPDC049589]|uniref:pyruvate, phosphate dikinase n=1 Tax=Patulibacter sp. NPDC049589 TaxID=3154731 RepID=UPI0034400C62
MPETQDPVVLLDPHTTATREVLGNKGASLVAMLALGLPVPPAFAVPVAECRRYQASGGRIPDDTWQAILAGVAALEERTGRRLGDPDRPLLVSVRSGAAVSMPGMMDTLLNLGLNDDVEAGLATLTGDPAFARATHRRFVRDYGDIVLGADLEDEPSDADAAALRGAIRADTGADVPADPVAQLQGAVRAVFDSWSSRRARAYRRQWGLDDAGGTAVLVQAMVFGNLGERSGTGVLFTRDPLTGTGDAYGEWLPGGQGDDVVGGTHDPLPLEALARTDPDAHRALLDAARRLEREHGDVQDVEFTVERGRLHLLQTRAAKRSPAAAIRAAVDFVAEGAIDRAEALRRVTPEQLATALTPRLEPGVVVDAEVLARGVAACPGIATGRVAQDSAAAELAAADGPVVLARPTTSPEDVSGMIAATAIVTERGGSTSHAAVVSRALGRPSVVGVGAGATDGWEGREVTVDGSEGVVYAGRLPVRRPAAEDVPGLPTLLEWAAAASPVAVRDDAPEIRDLEDRGLDPEGADDATLTDAMRGAAAVRGIVLGTDAGAGAAVAAGVGTVVPLADQDPLVLLLRLARAADAG